MFFYEARILWQADRSSDSVTTLAAMMVLAVAAAELGEDQLSRDILANARQMAESMHLFGVPHTSPAVLAYRQLSPQRTRAAAHAAWGAYGYLTCVKA